MQPGVKAKLGYHSGDRDWVDSGSDGQFISVPLVPSLSNRGCLSLTMIRVEKRIQFLKTDGSDLGSVVFSW